MAFERVGLQVVLQGVGQYVAGSNQVVRANAAMGTSFGAVGRAGGGIISTLTKIGALSVAALAGIGVAAVGSATKFQTTFAQIDVLTNTTTADTEKLRKGILEMTKVVPKSPQELGAAAYFVLSRGITDVDEAQKVVLAGAKAATIGLGETADVVKLVTGVLNAYGHETYTAARVTDILVQGVKEGGAEAKEYATQLGDLLGIASNLGVSFEEVVGIFASLTNVMDAPEAATGLKGILNQLSSPSKQALDTLGAYKLSLDGINESIKQKGLLATLRDLKTALNGDTQALAKIFPDVRGFNAFLLATGPSAQQAADSIERIYKATGVTDEGFKRMSQTVAFQAGLLKNQLNVALIKLGDSALPLVNQGVTKAIELWPKFEAVLARVGHLVAGGFMGSTLGGDIKGWEQAAHDFGETAKQVFDFLERNAPTALEGLQHLFSGGATALSAFRDVLAWLIDHQAALVGVFGIIGAFFVLTNPVWAGILVGGAILVGIDAMHAKIEDLGDPFLVLRKAINQMIIDLKTFLSLGTNRIPGLKEIIPDELKIDTQKKDIADIDAERARRSIARAPQAELDRQKKQNEQLAKDAGITYQEFLAKQIAAYTKANDDVLDLTDPFVQRMVAEYTQLTAGGFAAADATNKAGNAATSSAPKVDQFGNVLVQTGNEAAQAAAQAEKLTLALKDNIITLSESQGLGFTPAQSAAAELSNRMAIALAAENEQKYRLAVTTEQATQAAAAGQKALAGYTAELAKNALEASKAALGDILSNPSKETANLQLRAAQLQLQAAQATAGGGKVPKGLQSQIDRIQGQLAVIAARDQVTRAKGTANDPTLLSDKERQRAADAMITATKNAGTALVGAEGILNKQFSPSVQKAADAAAILWAAVNAPKPPKGGGSGNGPPSIAGHQFGGFFYKAHVANIAEGNKGEAIIPLTNESRGRALVSALPAGIRAGAGFKESGGGGGQSVSIQATGMTLWDLQSTVHREVDSAFKQLAMGRAISGSGLGNSVGPGPGTGSVLAAIKT